MPDRRQAKVLGISRRPFLLVWPLASNRSCKQTIGQLFDDAFVGGRTEQRPHVDRRQQMIQYLGDRGNGFAALSCAFQHGGDLFDAGIYRRGPRRAVSAGSIAVATDARKNAEPSRLPRFAAIEL